MSSRTTRPALAAASIVLSIGLAPIAGAQSVLHVDETGAGGAFTDIQPAVEAASEGDLLLVASGTYGGFAIDGKSVRILADAGASPLLSGSASVENLFGDQFVELSGLEWSFSFKSTEAQLFVSNCRGSVLVQDCTVMTFASECGLIVLPSYPAIEVVDSAALSIVGSVLSGTPGSLTTNGRVPYALEIVDSNVFAFDCSIEGARGLCVGDTTFGYTAEMLDGVPAVRLQGGTLLLSGSSVSGGQGAGAGILGDCVTSGPSCLSAGDGGPALLLEQGMQAPVVTRTAGSVAKGLGGPSATGGCIGSTITCSSGAPAALVADVQAGSITLASSRARAFSSTAVVRPGETKDVDFAGDPFDIVWLAYSLTSNVPTYFTDLLGPVYPAVPFFARKLGVLPATGVLSKSYSVGATGVDVIPLYEQAYFYDPADGVLASAPRFSVILDN